MKKIVKAVLLFICMTLTTSIFAQETLLANSVLWKIEGNDLEKASYLMGTIHIMCDEDFEIKNKIKSTFEACDDLVLEINFMDSEEMAIIQKSMMTGEKLSETLSKDQVSKLDKILREKMTTGIESFDQFSLTALYSLILMESVSCPNKKFWEMELISMAKVQDKPVHGLESIKGQIDFFANAYPTDEMIEQLDLMDEYADIFDTMIALYNEENIAKLGDAVNDPRFMDENAKYWMLEYRNKEWLKKMPEMMKERSNFFAVGSAHLVGEFGLIPMLQKLGYKVTPILN